MSNATVMKNTFPQYYFRYRLGLAYDNDTRPIIVFVIRNGNRIAIYAKRDAQNLK